MKNAQVKAVPVNSVIPFVQEEVGLDEHARPVESFQPEERRFLNGRFSPTSSHRTMWSIATVSWRRRSKANQCRTGDQDRLSVRHARAVAPGGAEEGASDVVSGRRQTENSGRIHIRDFPLHAAGCARITGWFEVLGEKSGAKDLVVRHAKRMTEGSDECLWTVDWK